MLWQFFHRANSIAATVTVYEHDLPDDVTLAAALQHAYSQGMPKGVHNTGCFEIQTDEGIYTREDYKRIDVSTPAKAAKVTFKTWEQLEAEEAMNAPWLAFR